MVESKQIEIEGKKFVIKMPMVGELFTIESKKILLSSNTYREQVNQKNLAADFNLYLIDAVATFSVTCPEMLEGFGVTSFADIHPKTAGAIVRAYKHQFYPWYKDILAEMYAGFDEEYDATVEAMRQRTADSQE